MSVQFSVAVRNARADAIENAIGASAILELRTGAKPANCAAADTGTVVCTVALPADWLAAASGGVKAKSGTWQDLSADAAGLIGHFRLKDSGGSTCHVQGSVTITGGGGDMTVDNPNLEAGQQFSISGFQFNEGNA